MTPLNFLMNHFADTPAADTFLKRQIAPRLSVVSAGLALEILAVAENAFLYLPFQAAQIALKLPAKVTNLFVNSKSLGQFERYLASPFDMLKTALKVVGFAVGAFSCLILGIINPKWNFSFHVKLGLITDEKAEREQVKLREEMENERKKQEKLVQEHLKKMYLANYQKLSETKKTEEIVDNDSPRQDIPQVEIAKTEKESDITSIKKEVDAIVASHLEGSIKRFA